MYNWVPLKHPALVLENNRVMGFSEKLKIFFSFFSIYIIWGTTYLAIIYGLESFPPFIMASFRFAIAGVLLLSYCVLVDYASLKQVNILHSIFLGLVTLIGGQGLLMWGEQYVSSGNAAVIVSSLPLWFVLLDFKNSRTFLASKRILFGILLGFLGICALFYNQMDFNEMQGEGVMNLFGFLAVIGSAICWVLGSLYSRSSVSLGGVIANLTVQLLAAAFIGILLSYVFGEFVEFSWNSVTERSWYSLLYLAIAGSIIAFVAYVWLLTKKPSVVVGTYAYVNPIVAVILGMIFLNENVSALQWIAIFTIILSAYLIKQSKLYNRSPEKES